MLCKRIRAASTIRLIGNDAVVGTPVERNRPVEFTEQLWVLLEQVCCTDTALLFALCEHVVGRHTSTHHVHQHGTTRTIVSTKGRTICLPMRLGLGELVGCYFLVHRIHMGNEQRFVCTKTASIYVQVACHVTPCLIGQVFGHMIFKPLGEVRSCSCVVWPCNGQSTGQSFVKYRFSLHNVS